ncbi:Zinc/iron permease [Dichotomocladium elegans]|nr:Zinc/iron permease [Dichotomocladium elegans]
MKMTFFFSGVFTPMVLHRIKPYGVGSLRYWLLTIGKFFGTGVILSVAFIHMIPESMERFESPCITSNGNWPEFEGFTGVFALIAVFFVQFVELAILTHVEQYRGRDSAASSATANDKDLEARTTIAAATAANMHNHHHHIDHEILDHEMKNIGTIILELGIVIHSVIIGLTLGFANSDEFNVLLIALVFHQFFEGIALGTRINEMDLKSIVKPLLMGLVFAFTTPVGVAIGIGVNLTVNPYSTSSVLAQAILEALAAGILLYNAFISLISAEITHNPSFRSSSLGHKFTCLMAMYIGAGLMAVLGIWA